MRRQQAPAYQAPAYQSPPSPCALAAPPPQTSTPSPNHRRRRSAPLSPETPCPPSPMSPGSPAPVHSLELEQLLSAVNDYAFDATPDATLDSPSLDSPSLDSPSPAPPAPPASLCAALPSLLALCRELSRAAPSPAVAAQTSRACRALSRLLSLSLSPAATPLLAPSLHSLCLLCLPGAPEHLDVLDALPLLPPELLSSLPPLTQVLPSLKLLLPFAAASPAALPYASSLLLLPCPDLLPLLPLLASSLPLLAGSFLSSSPSSLPDLNEREPAPVFLARALALVRPLCSSSSKEARRAVIDTKLVAALCSLLPTPLSSILPISSPLSRSLGRLSLLESCRSHFNADPLHLQNLAAVLEHYSTRVSLSPYSLSAQSSLTKSLNVALRVAFALGNLTASNAENRKLLGVRFGGSETVPRACAAVAGIYAKTFSTDPKSDSLPLLSDTLTKLTRLTANLSIDAATGARICAEPSLDSLPTLLMLSLEAEHPDLLLNTISAITNLSFYGPLPHDASDPSPTSRLFLHRSEICSCLVGGLLHSDALAVSEAARAFGNFSRDPEVRATMVAARSDEALACLVSEKWGPLTDETMFAVLGCLVNLASDPENNRVLVGKGDCAEYELSSQLIRSLRRFGLKRVPLSAVTCKILYNLSYGVGGAGAGFGSCFTGGGDDLIKLRNTLDELLDIAIEARDDEAKEREEEGEAKHEPFDAGIYDEFIGTGNALLGVVVDTLAIMGIRDEEEDEEEEEEEEEEVEAGGGYEAFDDEEEEEELRRSRK
ncbi:hypothetical protein TeGR_g7762 [Tetraparma gracilis]|uniref:Uncharacterized protein n=1 Tax=Tetraparma gracilis TaxID=2962635 RepID=A0ABQ6MX34_9STRA|nr:hypothetical protein TeGR_g7762 [Tetraparma gracilis]